MGSKSTRTQCRYRNLLKDQERLDLFFSCGASPSPFLHSAESLASETETSSQSILPGHSEMEDVKREPEEIEANFGSPFDDPSPQPEGVVEFDGCEHDARIRPEIFDPPIREESLTPPPLHFDDDMPMDSVAGYEDSELPAVRIREESRTPPRLTFDDPEILRDTHKRRASGSGDEDNQEEETEDGWEEELHEHLIPSVEIRSWLDLQRQIKADMKKHHKSMTLPQMNQLMILRNFATLQIKGHGHMEASRQIAEQWYDKKHDGIHFARRIRALARYYQVFEQLPKDNRGGLKNARSLLTDEAVQTAARSWLTEQSVGSITPQKFQRGLNTVIFPSLGISLKKPLCERTARRWLVKLGWTRTVIRKGVYMDGHERDDVIKYRSEVFLPKMKEFERRMARYEPDGKGGMKRIEPDLNPGEREIIAEFQDETCCQANDHVSSAW